MTTVVSPVVAALVAESRTWHTGRSKRTGEHFFLVPSRSQPGTAHYTCCYGCTCPGYLNRGRCAHVDAVQIVVAASMRPQPAPSLKSYRELYPACVAGCGELVERRGSLCYRCSSEQVHRQDMARKRELVAS